MADTDIETDELIASNKVEGAVVYDRKATGLGPSTISWSIN